MKRILALTLGATLAFSAVAGVSSAAGEVTNNTLSQISGTVSASAPSGAWYGTKYDLAELTVAGVPMGATFDAVQTSLGQPTDVDYWNSQTGGMTQGNSNGRSYSQREVPLKVRSLTYGGITYASYLGQSQGVGRIDIINRDATTARGIAVGDTLQDVYKAYGEPVTTGRQLALGTPDEAWFYGTFKKGTDEVRGIYFLHKNNRVTQIILINNI